MTDTPEALPPLLTDEQIAFCIYEARMESGTFKRDGTMSFRIARAVEKEVRAALAQRQQSASEAMPCGHHSSLQLKSAETGEPPYCELCDAQSGRRDAEQRESELAAANAERRAKLAEALAQRQQVPTTAWLVEWRFNGVQWLYLWSSAPGGFSFTSDASKALRFARREDAEAALQWARDTDAARRPIGSLTRQGLALGEMLVTEHAWPTFTAAPSAQAERRVECDACPTALGCLGKCMKATPPVAQAEPQVPLPYGFESGLVQLLNEARCLEGRIVGNRELASRIVDYIRRGIGKQEL